MPEEHYSLDGCSIEAASSSLHEQLGNEKLGTNKGGVSGNLSIPMLKGRSTGFEMGA